MTGRGQISLQSNRRLRILLIAHLIWLGVVCLLGAWWGRLLLRQSDRILELENQLGLSQQLTQGAWAQTHRMLFWESVSFFALLLLSSGFLFWLYWRDVRRSRGVQAFFAAVTHELRTPMTSIRLQAESIAESLEGSPTQRQLLDRLLEDTMRLESQVERTLELARVEGGGPLFTQSIPLKPWLDRFIQASKEAYGSKIDFEMDAAAVDEDLSIDADPSAVQVILRNVVENSLRHSRQTRVKLRINAASSVDQKVELKIQDNGQGFAGDAGRLGELFQKGPASQGAGVGLYLIQILMERMRGSVSFQSNSGFEVTLRFPVGERHG